MKSIILVGYMCVGKTTIGKALAKELGRTFYDLDWYIETRFRKKVPQIFAEEGEVRFREMERAMLREVAEFDDIVLSCGGGTPRFFDNIAYMNSVGQTLYLQASPTTICEHLAMSKGHRPLLAGLSLEELPHHVAQQLEERAPYYEQAHHTINVDILDNFDKVKDVVNLIRKSLDL